MASVNTTSGPQLKSNQIQQIVSRAVDLVQCPHQSTASDPPAAATLEVPLIYDSSNGPSTLQGRNQVNYGGIPDRSRSLHRPALTELHSWTDDMTIQQLRQIVRSHHAELLEYCQRIPTVQHLEQQLRSQNGKLLWYQRSADALEPSIKHAEIMNKAIVELEAEIAPSIPANGAPQPGTSYCHGFDLVERQRPGKFTRIGVVRFAALKLRDLRATLPPASRGRARAVVDSTRLDKPENAKSSASYPVSAQTPDYDSGDETEEDDWKGKGRESQSLGFQG